MIRDLGSGPNPGRWKLVRWAASSATLGFPQAAAQVAFALLAVSLGGAASGGAAMILAMTLAQVAGALPLTRLGRALPMATFLKLLLAARTAALVTIALGAAFGLSLPWLIALAAAAGLVNGAAAGTLRAVLNQFAPVSGMSRALGIAATLNELTFVAAPVVASVTWAYARFSAGRVRCVAYGMRSTRPSSCSMAVPERMVCTEHST